jgi:hypothetical protein
MRLIEPWYGDAIEEFKKIVESAWAIIFPFVSIFTITHLFPDRFVLVRMV